jgi:hypothetical protein
MTDHLTPRAGARYENRAQSQSRGNAYARETSGEQDAGSRAPEVSRWRVIRLYLFCLLLGALGVALATIIAIARSDTAHLMALVRQNLVP